MFVVCNCHSWYKEFQKGSWISLTIKVDLAGRKAHVVVTQPENLLNWLTMINNYRVTVRHLQDLTNIPESVAHWAMTEDLKLKKLCAPRVPHTSYIYLDLKRSSNESTKLEIYCSCSIIVAEICESLVMKAGLFSGQENGCSQSSFPIMVLN